MKLRTLLKKAQSATKYRGHRMTWNLGDDTPHGAFGSGRCRDCGAWAQIETKPAANSIGISGSAVATTCDRGEAMPKPAHKSLPIPTAAEIVAALAHSHPDAWRPTSRYGLDGAEAIDALAEWIRDARRRVAADLIEQRHLRSRGEI